jgi:ketosteroid isomerase-like protein
LKQTVCFLFSILLLTPFLAFAQPSTDDDVWSREEAYWHYVQSNDLPGYRSLWREDFLGWPFASPDPARKPRITNWITAHTEKGESLKSYHLERLTVQVSGDMATTTYRVRATWANKTGATQSETARIIHTWRREPDGTWKIFSGMSAPVDNNGH